ncbi:MAG: hypothetical protein MHMPM18_000332 [Marteilia pararefringens]
MSSKEKTIKKLLLVPIQLMFKYLKEKVPLKINYIDGSFDYARLYGLDEFFNLVAVPYDPKVIDLNEPAPMANMDLDFILIKGDNVTYIETYGG